MDILKYWTPAGFEISSYKWHLDERKNKSYRTSGSDNTGLCTYTYNELGFRGDSIDKKGFKIMSLGCSLTEGVGVTGVVVGVAVIAFCTGFVLHPSPDHVYPNMTTDQAIQFLESCQESHRPQQVLLGLHLVGYHQLDQVA